MFTPVEVFLGWRYTRAKRRNHFVSFISAIAMLGVALGVAALITILSIMNGFETELRDRILGMAAHVVITAERGTMNPWVELSDRAEGHPEVIA
ncbi:MAG: ABC transporter permease, partial [Gammaproteobacteria bacterium]|nr:ABC transporter permease [Gammaproteobacteria bacterium]